MMGEKLRAARLRKGWTQAQLGDVLATSQDTVSKAERDCAELSPKQVLAAAEALHAPELLLEYMDQNPVAQALLPMRYPVLNNVPLHPAIVSTKLQEEFLEAAEAARLLFPVFNHIGWEDEPEMVEQVIRHMGQIVDVLTGVDTLHRVLFAAGLLSADVARRIEAEHRRKCEERGYCKPAQQENDWESRAAANGEC